KALLTLPALILAGALQGQPATSKPQLSAVTHTAYSANTELFAEWRPFIVGQPTRLTAHLTHTGERFQAFAEGRVEMTLTMEDATTKVTADAPERARVFRLNLTPTKAGTGRAVIDVAAGGTKDHFVIDNVAVYPDLASATAAGKAAEPGLIGY